MTSEYPGGILSTLFAKIKVGFMKDIQFYLKFITCDPLMYEMNHPKFIELNLKCRREKSAM